MQFDLLILIYKIKFSLHYKEKLQCQTDYKEILQSQKSVDICIYKYIHLSSAS